MDASDTGTTKSSTRTCAGCREATDAGELVRFVAFGDEASVLVPDLRHKLPGRGVHAHGTRACLDLAVRGGFQKSMKRPMTFGRPGETGSSALVEILAEQLRSRVDGLLLAASRAGFLTIGTDAVREAVAAGNAELVLLADDAAGRREDIERDAASRDLPCVPFGSKESLGRLFRRDEVGVLCVLDVGLAHELLNSVTARKALLEVR